VISGVETAAQQEFLTRLGCDSLQGFLLGRPMSAEQLIETLSHENALNDATRVNALEVRCGVCQSNSSYRERPHMTKLPIADRWFELKRISDDITLLWEPHVVPLMRCNIWHVRGRDRDLMIDTGMGIVSLQEAARHLLQKDVTAVATHTHSDHIGGHHEFEHTLVHELEAENLRSPREPGTLLASVLGDEAIRRYREAGYPFDGDLITALPSADYSMSDYRVRAATVTEIVKEGNIVDLGNRHFEVLHLPGHSPGSIGLWEAASGTLFSGDAIYDGPLLDEIGGADIPTYVRTMKRLRELPVQVVHAGHDGSFGRERLVELVDAYLAKRT
jgi:glyoxylase-like metal-dependent hydrolase (beta-lactamase superfamily II)